MLPDHNFAVSERRFTPDRRHRSLPIPNSPPGQEFLVSAHSERLPDVGDLVAGRYRIIDEIGRGGYGVVFCAEQEAINRQVAIKFLLPDVAEKPTEVERFRREIFHVSGLEHPHTVTLYDYGKSPAGLVYVVMEYLEGRDLQERLDDDGPVPPSQVRAIVEQVLASLGEAHRRNLVHRDLKPDNIFLTETSDDSIDCRVLDFGLSKFIGDPDSTLYRGPSLTEDGEICGTPHYMSPEHAYDETVGPPGDIYSLGLVVYEALTGEQAFTGSTPLDVLLKQVNEPPPPLPSQLSGTPLADFVDRGTEKDADDRFANASEALEWLIRHPPQQTPKVTGSSAARSVFTPSSTPQTDDKSPSPQDRSDTSGSSSISGTAQMHSPTIDDTSSTAVSPETIDGAKLQPLDADSGDDVDEKTAAEPDIATRQAALERFELRSAQTPLIGRDAIVDELDTWFDNASSTGGLLALTGDAGAGKTATLDHWSARLKSRQTLRLLKAQQPRNAPPMTGLQNAFDSLHAPSPDIASRIDELFESSDFEESENQRSVRTVIHGLIDILDQLCRDHPVLLVFEDIHYADRLTRQFFDDLLDSLAAKPRSIAIVTSARDDSAIRDWTRIANVPFTHRRLPQLDDADIEDLLQRLLPVSDGLADGILQLSSGNPALLDHICRYLLERDELIEFDDERDLWTLVDPSIPIEQLVPLDLQELIIDRANRYLQQSGDESALRAILHRAVLLSDEFDAGLLEDALASGDRPELAGRCRPLLDELAASGLLHRRSEEGQARYGFARPLHRASLVRMVESIDDWRDFHRRIAALLIDRTHRNSVVAPRIADHLERAGYPDKALPWWLRAARRADTEHRYQDALQWLHRALELQSDPQADPELLASMRLRQGRLSRQVGELGPAEDALRAAIECARISGNTGLRARAGELLCEVVMLQGRLDEAAELLDDIDDLYDVLDDHRGRQRVVLARADRAIFRGRYNRATELFEQLQSSPEQSSQVQTRALVGQARCHYADGDLDEARTLTSEARHRANVEGHAHCEAAALIEASHIALITAGVQSSESLAHQALTLARRHHDLVGQANAHLSLGIALRRSTNLDRAHFHAERARELHESLGHLYGILKDLLLSAELAWMEAEPERALILAEDACQLHRELGDRHGWALSTLFRSLFLIELRRPNEARQLLNKVLDVEGRERLGLYEPHCLMYLGLACEADRDIESALQYLTQAHRIARQTGNLEIVSLAALQKAKLGLVLGRIDQARELIPRALELAEDLGHAHASIFALVGSALMARLDGDTESLRDATTRLRTYLVTPNAPDMRLSGRLRHLSGLVEESPQNPMRKRLVEAIDDLRENLSRN